MRMRLQMTPTLRRNTGRVGLAHQTIELERQVKLWHDGDGPNGGSTCRVCVQGTCNWDIATMNWELGTCIQVEILLCVRVCE